jgi:hypothetical protein
MNWLECDQSFCMESPVFSMSLPAPFQVLQPAQYRIPARSMTSVAVTTMVRDLMDLFLAND